MDLSRWQEVKKLVAEALDLPHTEYPNFLQAIGDQDLRQNVEILLSIPGTKADLMDGIRVGPLVESEVRLDAGSEVGSYRVIRQIGRGGMGSVYLAEDMRNGRSVALKVLSPKGARLTPHEGRTLARLNHPNIATLYESGTEESGLCFVAMEYVEGESITTYAAKAGLSVEARLRLFRRVCEAVAYAHQNLVVHRDLKPANISVSSEGEPKLLDFGIAKLLPTDLLDATLTHSSLRPLTIAFASPEQLGGEATSTSTDIYSLGVLLCLLLTGQLPYAVENTYELPWTIRHVEPKRPSDLLEESGERNTEPDQNSGVSKLRRTLQGDLDAIVLRALRKEPRERYASVAELSEDIRRYLENEPVTARRGTRSYLAWKFFRRHKRGAFLGTITTLALLISLAGLLYQERETRRQRDRANTVARFLVDMFQVPEPWTRFGQGAGINEVLDNAMIRMDSAPPQDAETRAMLRYSLGKVYMNLSLHTPAEELIGPALSELESVHGKRNPLVQGALRDLATLNYYQGRYEEAEGFIERGELARGSKISERDLNLLGHVAFVRGDYTEAARLFKELVTRGESGNNAALLANAYNDLACSLHKQGLTSQAEPLHRRSLELRRSLFGEIHISILQSLNNIALLYQDQGRLDDSETALRDILVRGQWIYTKYEVRAALPLHNLGSLLLTKESYSESAYLLDNSLTRRLHLLPDKHPDLARSLAERGRLLHAQRRLDEAEADYRKSAEELSRTLGPKHPDRLAVVNNLAALLAELGKEREAETLWREALTQLEQSQRRGKLRKALSRNLDLLRQGPTERYERYATLGVSSLFLSDLIERPSPPLPANRKNAERQAVLFVDDFEDGVIDGTKWEYGGNIVTEEKGELRIQRTVTDNGGWAKTRPIRIDPRRPIVICRRAKVYAGNRYFDGSMSVDVAGFPKRQFGVSYADYSYTGLGEVETVGFSLFRYDANSHRFIDRQTNATNLLPPIWGQWFDEEIYYDPVTGLVRYTIGGREHLVFNVGPLPPNAKSITVLFETWGWYTGHYQYVDSFEVRQ